MRNLLPLLKMILSGLLLSQLYSCMPPLYFPNGINAPLLSKKGEFVVNGGTDGSCTDVQLAASVSDNIGVLLNVNLGNASRQSSPTSTSSFGGSNTSYSYHYYSHEHSFYEAGAGIYKKIGTYGRSETFGLIGLGSASSSGYGAKKTGNYMRFAIQSDIGIETDFIEGIFSCRMGYLDMDAHYSRDNNSIYNYDNKNYTPSSFFADPAITFRAGWKAFKITTQIGLSIPFNNKSVDWNPGWATMGIQLKFM